MRLQSIALIILVLSMTLTTTPLQAFAESDLEPLIRLATQARDHINVRLSQLGDIPDETLRLYEQGVSETEALAEAVAENDVSSARLHFISAMKAFKEVSFKISSLSSSAPAPPTLTDVSRLKIMIDRMEQKAERLKAIATKNNVTLDFTELDRLIDAARQSLQEGNSDEAIKILSSAREFLAGAHNSLREAADQKSYDRAKLFIEKHIERLNLLIDRLEKEIQAYEEATDQTGDVRPSDLSAQVDDARIMLVTLKETTSEGKLDEAIGMLKSLHRLIVSIEDSLAER